MKSKVLMIVGLVLGFGNVETTVFGQAGSLDFSFNPGTGANGLIQSMVVQTNGQIIIGGQFSSFNAAHSSYVARLNTDGSTDSSFAPGNELNILGNGSAEVIALALQTDGKVLAGSDYGFAFARLRSDGSVDVGFTNIFADVESVAVQGDGQILAGGGFANQGGATYSNDIVRLGTNGTLDATFSPQNFWNAGSGLAGKSAAIGLQSDGRIIVGGSFDTLGGVSCNALARLNQDGGIDQSFNAGINSGGVVTSLAVTPQDQILIGGTFTSINGYSRAGVARLNSDGTVDTSFNPGLGANLVRALALQSDDKVVIAGSFSFVNGTNEVYIARLNTNGSLDLSYSAKVSYAGSGAGATCIASQPDGKMIIAGNIGTFNGTLVSSIARLNSDTAPTNSLQLLAPNRYFGTFLQGVVSNSYRIEWTSDLNSRVLWTPLFNITLQTNPQFMLDPTPVNGNRYYRAVQISP
jgi:uncharacterized delta-60 repeat protein